MTITRRKYNMSLIVETAGCGEMTCRSSDLDDLLVASSLVASLPDGETTRHHVGEFLSP